MPVRALSAYAAGASRLDGLSVRELPQAHEDGVGHLRHVRSVACEDLVEQAGRAVVVEGVHQQRHLPTRRKSNRQRMRLLEDGWGGERRRERCVPSHKAREGWWEAAHRDGVADGSEAHVVADDCVDGALGGPHLRRRPRRLPHRLAEGVLVVAERARIGAAVPGIGAKLPERDSSDRTLGAGGGGRGARPATLSLTTRSRPTTLSHGCMHTQDSLCTPGHGSRPSSARRRPAHDDPAASSGMRSPRC